MNTKYFITLASKQDDHFSSQSETYKILYNIGFDFIIWNMSTRRRNGDVIHRYRCYGNDSLILLLKLSADVEKIETIAEIAE